VFKQLLQADAVDIVQIDAAHVAGVNENLAVLLLAARRGIPISCATWKRAPHSPYGARGREVARASRARNAPASLSILAATHHSWKE
jgi:L-alanine-DL-glutamate epimerase-like enolase superfamily enzyme